MDDGFGGSGGLSAKVGARDEMTLELAKNALSAVSPEELPLIDSVGSELLCSVDAGGGDDGSLGFGGAEIVMSTAVLFVSRAVVDMLLDATKSVITEEASGFLRRLARFIRLRRAAPGGEVTERPALSREHIEQVRGLAYERAVAVGVDTTRASLLADAMAGSFSTAG
ncbi:MAG: hypothetical protein KY456_16020 [Chloroflexi bacterium]|nr:hypothetical protein [Chloroflexota bacterium]